MPALLEAASGEVVALRIKVDEYVRREALCDRKWTSLINENKMTQEQLDKLKEQVAKQRNTYDKLITQTQLRVTKANMMLADSQGEEQTKRDAAEFLAQQVHEMYEEKRALLTERDMMMLQNSDLQRLNIACQCDIERY